MSPYRKSKKFRCSYCEKDFDKERQLKSHMKDAHPTIIKSKEVVNDCKRN